MNNKYCKIRCNCSNCDTELIRYKLKQFMPENMDDLDYLCPDCYNEAEDETTSIRCQSCGLRIDTTDDDDDDDNTCSGCGNTMCQDCTYHCRKCDDEDCHMCKSCIDDDYDCCNCGDHMCRCEHTDEVIRCEMCQEPICKDCFEQNESFICNKCNE